MAIKPETLYPTRVEPSSPDYPQGAARDETAFGANDGTPYTAAVLNDIWGFHQWLLAQSGTAPSGSPDTAQVSQYGEALASLLGSPQWVRASPEGNTFDFGTGISFDLCALGPSRVVTINSSSYAMQTYDFDGADWAAVGNPEPLSPHSNAACALSPTRVAVATSKAVNPESLQAYDFDGTDWAAVGNPLTIGDGQTPTLCALSPTRVAYIGDTNETLHVYDFDGTDWAEVGTALVLPASATFDLVALSASRVAVRGNSTLSAYDFDGSTWTLASNEEPVVAGAVLAAVSSTDVLVFGALNSSGTIYRLDGDTWGVSGPEGLGMVFDPFSISDAHIAALNGVEVVVTYRPSGGVDTLMETHSLRQTFRQPYSTAGGAF